MTANTDKYKKLLSSLLEVETVYYDNRVRDLKEKYGEDRLEETSEKPFPVYLDERGHEEIFKPLSRSKPLVTPFFGISEVICSSIFHTFFDQDVPLYRLARCEGIRTAYPKYYEEGTLVPSVLSGDEKLITLYDVLKEHKEYGIDLTNYFNSCMTYYNYSNILDIDFFKERSDLGRGLSFRLLANSLIAHQNDHYENVNFLLEKEGISKVAPLIDHEFSSLFIYPDEHQAHEEVLKIHKKAISASLLDDRESDKITRIPLKNISYAVENYPEVAESFANNLIPFLNVFGEINFSITKSSYIGPVSSNYFQIGQCRYKRNNETMAKNLEETIIMKEIDLTEFSSNMFSEFHSVGTELKSSLDQLLNEKKPYTKRFGTKK